MQSNSSYPSFARPAGVLDRRRRPMIDGPDDLVDVWRFATPVRRSGA